MTGLSRVTAVVAEILRRGRAAGVTAPTFVPVGHPSWCVEHDADWGVCHGPETPAPTLDDNGLVSLTYCLDDRGTPYRVHVGDHEGITPDAAARLAYALLAEVARAGGAR